MSRFTSALSRIFRRENETKNNASAPTPREGGVLMYDAPLIGGSAMSVATVYRCMQLLTESVAGMPMLFQKLRKDLYVDAGDSRLSYLLNVQPSPAMSAFDFWRQVVQEMYLEGNAYIVPLRDPLLPVVSSLVICRRGTVQHDTDRDIYHVNDPVSHVHGDFREEEIIHLKGRTAINPKIGVSVLTYARLSCDIALTGDRETRTRFANGGVVRGIVSNDSSVKGYGKYQDSELKSSAHNLDEQFSNGERIVGLPGDVDFKQIALSSTDMQFLESRKFTVRELCRFFGVHPSFVFDDTSNNYKSAEQANAAFLAHTLRPLLRNIENEFLRKLVAPTLAHRYRFVFDVRNLHACDLDSQMNYRVKLLQTGGTVNEVRKLDNLEPVEGGDKPMVSANLRGVDEVGNQAPANIGKDIQEKDNDDDKEE